MPEIAMVTLQMFIFSVRVLEWRCDNVLCYEKEENNFTVISYASLYPLALEKNKFILNSRLVGFGKDRGRIMPKERIYSWKTRYC